MKKIFIAGPIFSQAEREFNLKIDSICKKYGHHTFMAQRDVGIVSEKKTCDFFNGDVDNLDTADLIIANLDGIDIDSGTAWEIGYAYSKAKKIIAIRTDVRVYRKFLDVNLMINQSCNIVKSMSELEEIIQKL